MYKLNKETVMTTEKKYEHGNAGRKPKTFRIPGDLIDKLKGESNQTAIVVKALIQYYGGKKGA
jgi:hypothetical protein